MIDLKMIQSYDFEELKEYLLQHSDGKDSVLDDTGGACLHYAAWGDYIELANFLINQLNDNVNRQDIENSTPLHLASYGSLKIAELLLKSGADVNAPDYNGNTPLHFAVFRKQVDIVKLLMEYGAWTNIKAQDGMTPIDIATEEKYSVIIELMKPVHNKNT